MMQRSWNGSVSTAYVRPRWRGVATALAAVLGICVFPGRAGAQETVWQTLSGSWSVASNWTGGDPNWSVIAYVNNGGSVTVTDSGDAARYIYLGSQVGARGSVAVVSGGKLSVHFGEYVGFNGTGSLVQSGGDNTVAIGLYLGSNAGSVGTYLLNGPGSLTVGYGELVGGAGTGYFTQSDGNNTTAVLYLGLNAGSVGTYVLTGPGRLTVNAEYAGVSGGSGSLSQSDGDNTVSVGLYLGVNATSSGSYMLSGRGRLSAADECVGQEGAGYFLQTGGQNTAGHLSVGAKGQYDFMGGTLRISGGLDCSGTLSVGPAAGSFSVGGPVKVGSGGKVLLGTGTKTHVFPTLTLAGAADGWTGTVDIGDGFLVVKTGDAAAIENQVKSGMNLAGGYWNGRGITSSAAAGDAATMTGVGVLSNSLAHYTTFGSATGLTGSEVLVRYTFYGDADLSGAVDFDNDYILWQTGYLNGYTGWVYGDFNHDGVVDFDNDYILWQTLFLNQPVLPGSSTAVPEPGTLALVLLGGLCLLRRRRE
jgi:hypothetical protein